MNKPLALSGSILLALSSAAAWAQVPPPSAGTATLESLPVPGTGDAVTSPQAALADQLFGTTLSGLAEVPPQQTDATGAIAVTLDPDGTRLHYRLSVDNIDNLIGAHLHLGLPDENGPVVVPLLGEGAPGNAATPPQGAVSGVIAEGEITAADLTGPLAGTPPVVLLELMRSGAIYANVHSTDFPAGEIRGQVKGLGPSPEAIELLSGLPGGPEGPTGTTGDTTTGGTTDDTSGTTTDETAPVTPST